MKRSIFWLLLVGLLGLVPSTALAATQPISPAPESGAFAPTASCVYHTVRRGETLALIASYYGTTAWNIASANGLSNINWIYPGQVLVVPCGGTAVQRVERVVIYEVAAPPPPPPARTYAQPAYYYCDIQPILGFGRIWHNNANVRNSLGCPAGGEVTLSLQAMRYRGGWLWWNRTFGRWELLNSNNGRWALYYDGEAARHAAGNQLGTMLTGPFDTTGTYQLYQSGAMIWTPATGSIVFFNQGNWRSY
jgi:hypothetical protein